jgi:hypothetical protein
MKAATTSFAARWQRYSKNRKGITGHRLANFSTLE